jgi:hypothetical protein
MAFHISPKDGQPRPCKAATPESCPVGGEHFADKAEAQSFAETKLASEYESAKSLSRKVDLSQFESMEKLPDGRYAIEPGEYYVICSEGVEIDPSAEKIPEDLSKAIYNPSNGTDNRANTMVGGYIGKEPIYTVVEGWSGVANSFVSPKLYDALTRRGMKFVPDGEKPPVVAIMKPTTLGGVSADESADSEDYGFLEIGDKKVDLFNEADSIILSERTVID